MKIAIDCRFLGKSGIGTFLSNILTELLENHEEHKYLLICGDDAPQIPQMARGKGNVDVVYTDIKALSARELMTFPCKAINRCDVYFSPYINIPRGIRIPVISTIHDVIFMDMPELTSKKEYWLRLLYLKRTIWQSTAILTVSEFSKQRIQHHFKTKKPISVVYNAVSEKIKSYGNVSTPTRDYFLFVGNIKRHKGLSSLLKAYKEAKEKGLKEKLVLVGKADTFRTSDEEFTQLLQKTKDVEFTGYVSDDELYSLIYNAKALVQPSLYEGFGLPPIEAMYIGTKAIVSDIEVFKELFSDLPVTFFKCGDSEDLTKKLLACDGLTDNIKETIDQKFGIGEEVDDILKVIKKSVQASERS